MTSHVYLLHCLSTLFLAMNRVRFVIGLLEKPTDLVKDTKDLVDHLLSYGLPTKLFTRIEASSLVGKFE